MAKGRAKRLTYLKQATIQYQYPARRDSSWRTHAGVLEHAGVENTVIQLQHSAFLLLRQRVEGGE